MRISELADRVGVPTSTVRYYERVGLLAGPSRTMSGYRDYNEDDASRLLFIFRARGLGLSCEQIADLLPVWHGANCAATYERVVHLIEDKQAEISARIRELKAFAGQLSSVGEALHESPPPAACCDNLSCCVPESKGMPVAIELAPRRTR